MAAVITGQQHCECCELRALHALVQVVVPKLVKTLLELPLLVAATFVAARGKACWQTAYE